MNRLFSGTILFVFFTAAACQAGHDGSVAGEALATKADSEPTEDSDRARAAAAEAFRQKYDACLASTTVERDCFVRANQELLMFLSQILDAERAAMAEYYAEDALDFIAPRGATATAKVETFRSLMKETCNVIAQDEADVCTTVGEIGVAYILSSNVLSQEYRREFAARAPDLNEAVGHCFTAAQRIYGQTGYEDPRLQIIDAESRLESCIAEWTDTDLADHEQGVLHGLRKAGRQLCDIAVTASGTQQGANGAVALVKCAADVEKFFAIAKLRVLLARQQ